jgi:methylated-DNA-[protein]-cysteine S-methyltransferase
MVRSPPIMSAAARFTLFETPIGSCGIAWGERGVVGVLLPEGRAPETRARLLRRHPGALEQASPPVEVRRAVEGILALLRGEASDLGAVPLDMRGVPPFHRRVYEVARAIRPGETLSYGQVAARLGSAGAARAVGQALGRNPFAIVVPCHRVLAAGGKVGGFSAKGGITTKLHLLTLELPAAIHPSERLDGGPARGLGLGFGFDPAAAVAHLRAVEPALARLIDAVGPFAMRLNQTPSLFAALAEAIVYQQLTGKAAATIFGRVRALFRQARDGLTPAQILRASDDRLRGAGLSRSKLLSLRDLAEKAQAGEIPTLDEIHGMDDQSIVERLTRVRGIGRWTAEMLLMFRLGRPDVLPVDDYGIRKGFALAFKKRELPAPRALERRGARWSPYRTAASWYLWRALDLAKAAAPPSRAPAPGARPRSIRSGP